MLSHSNSSAHVPARKSSIRDLINQPTPASESFRWSALAQHLLNETCLEVRLPGTLCWRGLPEFHVARAFLCMWLFRVVPPSDARATVASIQSTSLRATWRYAEGGEEVLPIVPGRLGGRGVGRKGREAGRASEESRELPPAAVRGPRSANRARNADVRPPSAAVPLRTGKPGNSSLRSTADCMVQLGPVLKMGTRAS